MLRLLTDGGSYFSRGLTRSVAEWRRINECCKWFGSSLEVQHCLSGYVCFFESSGDYISVKVSWQSSALKNCEFWEKH